MNDAETAKPGFAIYRAKDAPGLMDTGRMSIAPTTDVQRAGMKSLVAVGYLDGDETKVLVDKPGFALTHAWLKASYPLALHSHDSDCLYHIVAGSLRLGTEELGPRDSFFVPANTPYTYTPGPDGVEVLEFRHEQAFNFVNLSKGEAFYTKAAATISANRQAWQAAKPPSGFESSAD
jgi:hypothetical protein